jgi:hypothetical protein
MQANYPKRKVLLIPQDRDEASKNLVIKDNSLIETVPLAVDFEKQNGL